MSGNRINVEGVMLFEQPFAKVPYENYRKVFRVSQKNIEKDLGAVQSLCSDLAKRARTNYSPEDSVRSIDAMIGRVESLKGKLSELHQGVGKQTQDVMRERLQHLAAVETTQNRDDPEFERWSETRLNRWIVDWALRTGKQATAKKLAREKGIERLVDIDLFMDIHRIEDALRRHSCTEALAWCNENKTALRKIKSTLEFDLRLQEFIELARARQTEEAIAYSKKHLISWQDTHLAQIRHVSALLAFPATTTCGPYKRLYDPTRWDSLVTAFRLAIYTLNTLPVEPSLHLALYAGLASLRLPTCYNSVADGGSKNPDCPVCDADGLGRLAEEVPFSHHLNSTIVCQISGKIMDEDNPPMAFPNGYVYSRQALEQIAMDNNGIVTCPRSNKSCSFSELRKVFIS